MLFWSFFKIFWKFWIFEHWIVDLEGGNIKNSAVFLTNVWKILEFVHHIESFVHSQAHRFWGFYTWTGKYTQDFEVIHYSNFYSSFWIWQWKWPRRSGLVTVTTFWDAVLKFIVLQPSHLNCTSWGHCLIYRDGEYHFGNGRHYEFFLARNRVRAGTGTGSGNFHKSPYFWTTFGLILH